MTAIRLQRFLSQAGVAARRKAEILIKEGVVTVNGDVVTEMGVKVEPGVDRVCVDGKAVYPEDPFYVLLNKPKGCITTVSDPHGRLTVMDYLRNVPATVAPVGRLDFYSEGVLLLTNDGELAARLLTPARHVEKTYHVKIRGRIEDRDIETMRNGVRLDRRTVTRTAQVDRLRTQSRHDWLVITITEGKSRQIHRMLEALGHTVLKLQRVAFASLTFHGLRVGDSRELTQTEVNELRQAVALPKSTVSRGKWNCRREDTELSRRAKLRQQAQNEAGPQATQGGRPSSRSTDRRSPDRRSPDSRSTDRRSPDRRSPDRRSPDRRSTDRRSPDRRSTDRRSPDRRSTDRRSPDRRSTDGRSTDRRPPGRPQRPSRRTERNATARPTRQESARSSRTGTRGPSRGGDRQTTQGTRGRPTGTTRSGGPRKSSSRTSPDRSSRGPGKNTRGSSKRPGRNSDRKPSRSSARPGPRKRRS